MSDLDLDAIEASIDDIVGAWNRANIRDLVAEVRRLRKRVEQVKGLREAYTADPQDRWTSGRIDAADQIVRILER